MLLVLFLISIIHNNPHYQASLVLRFNLIYESFCQSDALIHPYTCDGDIIIFELIYLVYTPSFGESHAMNIRKAFHFGASLIPSIKMQNNRKIYLGQPFTTCIRKAFSVISQRKAIKNL